jgi:hypothetical protein
MQLLKAVILSAYLYQNRQLRFDLVEESFELGAGEDVSKLMYRGGETLCAYGKEGIFAERGGMREKYAFGRIDRKGDSKGEQATPEHKANYDINRLLLD